MKIKIPFIGCLALAMLMLFNIEITWAQGNNILGKIQDEQGIPISGATIRIKNSNRSVPSATDGTFEILNVESQELTLQISFLGYQNQELKASAGQFLTVILLPSSNTMDQVFVTGTFDKRKRMDASVAISTLNASQMEKLASTSAADLLKNVPGVFVNSSLGEIRNSVASRGITVGTQDGSFGYEYVSMQEDGIPITNATYFNYGPDFFLRPDVTLYRLEAVRGGTASITAANAPGGIFNYVSKTGSDTKEGEVRLKYGLLDRDGHSYSRADISYGGPLGNNWYYNIGGFF
ncbi:TonB-dependent receptor [Sphingobacterium sp. WM]|uniref:TonB-dependent receptor n=1 Tax=Sphingobacterium sp. WM TaxID=3031802 RepID=UPI00240D9C74|nr:TonB-dependent receptor [Sphingobacterium sp. WM]WFB64847.1 TonB-dependent receptor [Sphingobacterium sp. WM]